MTHDELADRVRELERQLAHAQRERDQWKGELSGHGGRTVQGTRPTPATTHRSDLAAQQRRRLNGAKLDRYPVDVRILPSSSTSFSRSTARSRKRKTTTTALAPRGPCSTSSTKTTPSACGRGHVRAAAKSILSDRASPRRRLRARARWRSSLAHFGKFRLGPHKVLQDSKVRDVRRD